MQLKSHELLPAHFRLEELGLEVVTQFGALRRRLDRLIEIAKLIDEPVLARILARPDASLRNHVDLGRGLAAAGSYVVEEYRVGMFDPRLQHIACHRSEGTIQAEISAERRSAHA